MDESAIIDRMNEINDLKAKIHATINRVNSTMSMFGNKSNSYNSVNLIINNTNKYWIADDSNAYNSIIKNLSELKTDISDNGNIYSSGRQVLGDANRKLDELDSEFAALELSLQEICAERENLDETDSAFFK